MIKKTISLFLLQLPIMVLGFITTLLITRHFGVYGYGVVAFMIVIGNIFAVVIRYGFDETLLVSLKLSKTPQVLFFASVALRYFFYLIFLLGACVFSKFGYLSFKEIGFLSAFLLVVLQVPVIFDLNEDQIRHVKGIAIGKLLFVITLLVLLIVGIDDEIAVYAIASLIGNIFVLLLHFRYYKLKLPFKREINITHKQIFSYSGVLFKQNFFVMISGLLVLGWYSLNQFFLKNSLDYTAVGVFAVQWQMINIFIIFIKQVTRIFKPRLATHKSKGDIKSFRHMFFKYLTYVTLIPSASSLIIWIFYDSIFPRIFGSDLIGYDFLYLLLTIFLFFRGIMSALSQRAYLEQNNSFVTISNLTGLLAIVTGFVMIGSYENIQEAAILMTIGCLFSIVALTVLHTRSATN